MKKQFLFILLAVCVFTTYAATTPATQFTAGDGSIESPYEISSVAELLFMRDMTNDADESVNYRNKHYILTADIDMAAEEDWIPICKSQNTNFNGTLDGKGFAIKNLKYGVAGEYSSAEGDYIVLFGNVKNGTISNLRIEDVAFYTTVVNNNNGTAGIVASISRGAIDNCYVSGILMTALADNNTTDIRPKIGGIVGRINTPGEDDASVLITNCYTDVTISASTEGSAGRLYAGGIVGFVSGSAVSTVEAKIVNCYSASDVSAIGENLEVYAAGIAGELSGSINMLVANCYGSGSIYAKGNNGNAGGIVGRANGPAANVSNCIALNNSIRYHRTASATNPTRVAKKRNG